MEAEKLVNPGDFSYETIGAAIEVHKTLGPGLLVRIRRMSVL